MTKFAMRRRGPRRGPIALLICLGVAATFVTGAGARQEAMCVPKETDGNCLPTAPASALVDLEMPTFTNPTTITNLLFPISKLHSVVMLGRVDRLPFRTEVTLLPETKTIAWNGQSVEVLVSQYVAFLDGRLHEVALDWYAQADDGSVWYFGEDVFNFEDGVVVDTEGTWLAGKDGPPAMIMPADPQVGDVYRPENIPGLVFEEVTVKSTGLTVNGPQGPVDGAILVEELHQDGSTEEKIFAPGYGEFLTGSGGEVEALALAVPTDALPDLLSAELDLLSTSAAQIFDAAQSEDWDAADSSLESLRVAWDACQAGDVPTAIDAQMSGALVYLVAAVDARQSEETRQAALDVERASLDFKLRHRLPVEIDLARLHLQARQLLVNVAGDDPGAATGDVATLERIWDRVAHAVDPSTAKQIVTELDNLRAATLREDLTVAADSAAHLGELIIAAQ